VDVERPGGCRDSDHFANGSVVGTGDPEVAGSVYRGASRTDEGSDLTAVARGEVVAHGRRSILHPATDQLG
jgi:hypothetical protein